MDKYHASPGQVGPLTAWLFDGSGMQVFMVPVLEGWVGAGYSMEND